MKIVFMGTPVFAVPVLEGLINQFEVVGVVTQPDKEIGRKKELRSTPIKELAIKNNIKVISPLNIKKEYQAILDLEPDILITCAYGQFVPRVLLDYPKYGAINVHGSLLPKRRGGAPIHTAIKEGYQETGITIMKMAPKMDAGDIISQKKITIEKNDTYGSLHDKMSVLGKKLLLKTLPHIYSGDIKEKVQNEKEVTFAYNIKREEEKLDFEKSNTDVYNHIRGYNPTPGTYAVLNGKIIKVWSSKLLDSDYPGKTGEIINIIDEGIVVKTKEKAIILTEVQPEGKKRMDISNYLNGINREKIIGEIFN